jgi:mannose-6-phosphate isomerase-like protein (cupin superfamily)
MSDITKKDVSEIGYYQGPSAIAGIKFHHAAKDLGVTAWGMNVLEIDAGVTDYPEHDHASDGQEEVYVVLAGDGHLQLGDRRTEMKVGTLIRVGPREKRKIIPGSGGITVLAIGATPGEAYRPRT